MISRFLTRAALGLAWTTLGLGAGLTRAAAAAPAVEKAEPKIVEAAGGPSAAKLKALASAAEAELWLEQAIPAGLTVGEAPDFFEAADEVFFEAGEGLHVFAYRSAETGKWIAWVAFDADRNGVAHTAAIELER